MAIMKSGDTYFPAVASVSGLGIPLHDYLINTYTGSDLTQTVFKRGGASGVVVATLTMTYDGNGNLLTVTRSV